MWIFKEKVSRTIKCGILRIFIQGPMELKRGFLKNFYTRPKGAINMFFLRIFVQGSMELSTSIF